MTHDERGLPHRALDLLVSYRVGVAALEIELTVTNRAREEVSFEVAWALGADFADIQEAHAGARQQEADIRSEASEAGICLGAALLEQGGLPMFSMK